jgi:cysteine desulfurase/selenocysteine lyase
MDDRPLIYLDNAATSFPKPRAVLEAMINTYARLGVSPGRGSYDLSMEAEELVGGVRAKLTRFFGAPDPDRVIFTANATDALNIAIQGIVAAGDHVVSTRLEHNSVLRPLFHLHEHGLIEYDLVPFDAHGRIDPETVAAALRANTRLVIVSHASSVLGTTQPIGEIADACAARGVPLLVDAAQSAGHIPVTLSEWGATAVAFTGHKALLGPSGIGGLALSAEAQVAATRFGGTGIDSRSLRHTPAYPHRLEAGTLNLLGIIGLSLGLDHLEAQGVERTHRREMVLIQRLRDGLICLPRLTIHSPPLGDDDIPVLACSIEGIAADDVGAILDADYGIAVRTGLQCAPLAHHDLGTEAEGGVRFSLGIATTELEIDAAIDAMEAITKAA